MSPIRREGGYATVGFVATVALSLVLFVLLAGAIVQQYARGAIRSALDEGVRAGALAGAPEGECARVATEALDQLLGGPIGQGVSISCVDGGDVVRANASGSVPFLLPLVPDLAVNLTAVASDEAFFENP